MLSTERIPAEVMVVEGWVPDFVIAAAVNEFASHNCRQAFVTGGPARGMGGYTNDYCNTSASVGAVKLRAAGLSAAMVQMVPSRVMSRNRTYTAAVAEREWTRLLFQKAFGHELSVGVVSVRSPDYNGDRWWLYSEGIRDVTSEALAYAYARLLFWPR